MVAKKKVRNGTDRESLGQRIARFRQLRGFTQTDLAERIGLSQPNISEYERDAFRPNADTLLHMAQVLRISADELLGHRAQAHTMPLLSRKLMQRMARIEKLSKTDQRALLKTIDTYLKGAQA